MQKNLSCCQQEHDCHEIEEPTIDSASTCDWDNHFMECSTCSTFGDIQAPTATEGDHLCTVSGGSNSTQSIYNIPACIDPCELMNTLKPNP